MLQIRSSIKIADRVLERTRQRKYEIVWQIHKNLAEGGQSLKGHNKQMASRDILAKYQVSKFF